MNDNSGHSRNSIKIPRCDYDGNGARNVNFCNFVYVWINHYFTVTRVPYNKTSPVLRADTCLSKSMKLDTTLTLLCNTARCLTTSTTTSPTPAENMRSGTPNLWSSLNSQSELSLFTNSQSQQRIMKQHTELVKLIKQPIRAVPVHKQPITAQNNEAAHRTCEAH